MDDKASDHAAVVPHGSHDLLRMAMIYATPAGRVQPPVSPRSPVSSVPSMSASGSAGATKGLINGRL
jgi:hypothetical protein